MNILKKYYWNNVNHLYELLYQTEISTDDVVLITNYINKGYHTKEFYKYELKTVDGHLWTLYTSYNDIISLLRTKNINK